MVTTAEGVGFAVASLSVVMGFLFLVTRNVSNGPDEGQRTQWLVVGCAIGAIIGVALIAGGKYIGG